MRILEVVLTITVVAFLQNCTGPGGKTNSADEVSQSRIVHFNGRDIDLAPYIEGFPFSRFTPFYTAGKMYYLKQGKTTSLFEIDLYGNHNLKDGKKISEIDFSTRNCIGLVMRKMMKLLI